MRRAKWAKKAQAAGRIRYNESDARRETQGCIRNRGVGCWPVENKVANSIPDTYVDGGNWVEFKKVIVLRGVAKKKLFSVPKGDQKLFLGRPQLEPERTWDRTFLLCLCLPPEENHAWLVGGRYEAFCHPDREVWDWDMITTHGVNFDDKDSLELYIAQLFDRKFYRNSDWEGPAAWLSLKR